MTQTVSLTRCQQTITIEPNDMKNQFCKESKYVGMELETIGRELGIEIGSS